MALFRQFGEVARFRFLESGGGDNNTARTYGFCDFTSEDAVEEAKKQDGILTLQGNVLTIKPTKTTTSSQRTSTYTLKLGRDLDQALAEVKIGEKYDVLLEFKQWVRQDAEGVRDLLQQRPTVAQTLLKLFIEFKMCYVQPDMSLGNEDEDDFTSKRARIATTPEPQPAMPNLADSEQLLRSVLALTEMEISVLDPQEQFHVRSIRASYGVM